MSIKPVWRAALTVAAAVLSGCSDSLTAPTSPGAPAFGVNGNGRLAVYNGGVDRAVPDTPCLDDARHRQLDFWVGSWQMGAQRSIVRSLLDGCIVEENYMVPAPPTAPGGPPGAPAIFGRSLSAYDPDTERWHQTWVSVFPTGHLRMSGGYANGIMQMGLRFPGFVVDFQWERVGATDVRQSWTFNGGGNSLLYTPLAGVTLAEPAPFPFCQAGRPAGENRRLDFLHGSWSVQAEHGPILGSANFASDLNGCLTRENYATDKGYAAHSYIYYDASTRNWNRTYIDSESERSHLSGSFTGGALVLLGAEFGPGNKIFQVRNTIRPIDASTTLQTWETSPDGIDWTLDLSLTFTRK